MGATDPHRRRRPLYYDPKLDVTWYQDARGIWHEVTLGGGGGGGGGTDHSLLTDLSWTISGHNSTADTFAIFGPTGFAATTPIPLIVGNGGTGATTAAAARNSLAVAPSAPQYVTLATDAELGNERVLTAGLGIDIVDGGAGGAVTVSTEVAPPQTVTYSAMGTTWQQWTRPTGHKMMQITLFSGQAGGGGGHSAAAGVDRRGGGGGATGSVGVWVGPALWADLYVLVGRGGAGGAAGGAGGAGELSYCSTVSGQSGNDYLVCKSGNSTPTGGAAGGAGAGGQGGTAGSTPSTDQAGRYSRYGQMVHIAGLPGAAGSSSAAGSISPNSTSLPITAGAGGGGVTAANAEAGGGSILAATTTALVLAGAAGGGAGNPGVTDAFGLQKTAGSGGGGNNTGTGGAGGASQLACGGSGGGGGITGGAGSSGGNGWIEIRSW